MKLRSLFLALSLTILGTVSAIAAPLLDVAFSGGNGTPLTITFTSGLTLTPTTELSGTGLPVLVFHSIYSGSPGQGSVSLASQFNYTVNGAADIYKINTPYILDSSSTIGSLTSSDFTLTFTGYIPVNNVFSIAAGTSVISTSNVASNPSAYNSSFSLFLMDDATNAALSSSVMAKATLPSAVPEPSTYALLAGLGFLGFAVMKRRK